MLLPFFLLSLLISCKIDKSNNQESIDGYWKSVGYDEILKIQKDTFERYETTTISCIPTKTAPLKSLGKSVKIINDTLTIAMGTGVYHFTKIDALPSRCTTFSTNNDDPVFNFEVFANTIENNYAYFELNKINWDSLYQISKNKVHPISSAPELYLVMEEMVTYLNDNHGYIEPTDEVYNLAEAIKPKQENVTNNQPEYGDFQVAQMAAESFLDEEFTNESWLMQWGKLGDKTGYLQIKSMWLYADLKLNDSIIKNSGYIDAYVDAFLKLSESDYIEKERKGVANLMDRVMDDLYTTDTLLIDIRFNGGGQDVVSLEILKHFNDQRRKISTKKAISENGFTPKIPIYLDAVNEPYLKPVYVLTSQQTGSAAEIFALTTLELSHVTRIGSHTSGALSDAFERQLPNGWHFSLSNEVYTDLNGKCYENEGIPVHIELNYPSDRQRFFRSVVNNLESDKTTIINTINSMR